LSSRPRLLFPLLLALVAVVSLTVAACGSSGGSSGGNSKDATTLLDTAFKQSIKSANVSIDVEVGVSGVPQLKGPISLKLSGPFASAGSGKLPTFDFNANITGGGQSLPVGATSTGDDLFITLRGTSYEVGKQLVTQINSQLSQQAKQNPGKSLSAFGVSPLSWLSGAKKVGDSTVAGTKVTHISAKLNVGKLLDDLNRIVGQANVSGTTGAVKPPTLTAAQKAEIQKVVGNPSLDVYVAKSDNTLRRLATTINITVPKDQQSKVGGLTSGTIKLSIELANVGQPVTVKAPSNPQPLSALTGAISPSALGLGGSPNSSSGGGSSAPSTGSSTPSAKKFQEYSDCIKKAGGSDPTALQKCAEILTK
jgi:hypothetical protein